MIYITVPDLNDSFSSIILDGKEYLLRFTYNMVFDYWTFGVYDVDETAIVAAVKIVPNYSLLSPYTDILKPPGEFAALSSLDNIGRKTFNNGEAEFIYFEFEDLVSLGS